MEKSIKCTLEICVLLCVYTKSQCKGLFGDEGWKSFHKKVWEEKQVSVSNIDYFTFLNILNILQVVYFDIIIGKDKLFYRVYKRYLLVFFWDYLRNILRNHCVCVCVCDEQVSVCTVLC